MLKHVITVLQETLGIHLITTRNITSINEGREALFQIVRCFNSPKRDVTNELLTENIIIKHNLRAAEKTLKESKEQLKKLSVELKKYEFKETLKDQYDKIIEEINEFYVECVKDDRRRIRCYYFHVELFKKDWN